ncbi:hypothetical protein H0H92_011522 [Tricholoma furcatifolium]|nr:hypothetical protein H0H92_011522 [Tricholoma furcatifolium]
MSSHRSSSSSTPVKSLSAIIKPWVQITRVSKFAGTLFLFWPYGAGCIWNDILDREFDRQVERCKNRPIASGKISVFGALVFMSVHIALLLRLIWNLDAPAFTWGLISIFVLPGIYPYMKRITHWPQAWLGLTMNCGVAMAWLALGQGVPTSIAILYAGAWAWMIWTDTVYACQDKRDDLKAGVKSTAILFGSWIKPILGGFCAMFVASLFIAGVMNNMGAYYHIISVFGAALYLAYDIITVDLDTPKACWDSFNRNGFGLCTFIWVGAFVDYVAAM